MHGNFWITNNNTPFTFFLNALGLQSFFPMAQSFNCPAWSLTAFFTCWIIFYIIIFIAKGSKSKHFIFCTLMVALGVTIQINLPTINIPLFNLTIARAYISFFMGGIVYLIHSNLKDKHKVFHGYFHLGWLIICMMLYINDFNFEPFDTTMALCIFPSIIFVVIELKYISSFLSAKIFRFFGKISFSLYLWNFTFQIFTIIINDSCKLDIHYSSIGFFVTNMILQVILANSSWKIIENKIPNKIEKHLQIYLKTYS